MQYQDQEAQVLQVYTVNEYITNPISQVNISTGNKTDNYLTLCEVEIYGDCPEGKHDLDCNQTCDAKCGHHCSTYDGSCNYICLGFSNPPECNKSCPSAVWGVNCTLACNTLCKNSSCNKVTGQCNNGCSAGYRGLWCNEECPEGQWGDDCSNNCSSNCWTQVCNKQSGLCESGCHGFSNPPDCTQDCPDGSWGLNCHSKCSTQCINQICQSVTGHCMFNCTEGCNYLTYSEVKETGKNEMTFGAGMGIGFVLGVVVIATLEVIMLIIYRVRKKSAATSHENKDLSNDKLQAYDGVNEMNVYTHSYETTCSPELKGDKLKDTSQQTSQYSNVQSMAYENL
ncbi:platelet endothelial aggregation receptor 1-like isoform X2 [Biomphalaria glabrata]|uniref:Platelet endothelial aggregation receptor 1-like isoform X2 n=1 Tax=Biomphalaria glabrata TaxID=6526 RepID=A0A9W3ABI2_BIOGL|nr:platelet endothelial aggregation receptor 1-like isoform X2 [Biomphalaria glabrata]